MRQDIKDLADSMERGWKIAPKNCYWFFNNDGTLYNMPVKQVKSACAMGHALLGINTTDIANLKQFPALYDQKVAFPRTPKNLERTQTLEWTLNDMLNEGWTTPQIIAWLRTHQEDE